MAFTAASAGTDTHAAVRGALAVVRELLGMDVAYLARIGEEHQQLETLEGDAASFGLSEGDTRPLEQTFCARMVAGEIPNVVADAAADARTADIQTRADLGIGAYVGVPVTLSDGRLYGSFCCLSHEPDPRLQERDARYVAAIARLVADHIEREELAAEAQLLEVQSAGFGALLAALEVRDSYTGEHSEAVVRLAGRAARRLKLSAPEVAAVEQVALIHDVGKIGIPDAVLQKRGPLTEDEWEVMRRHPVIGGDLVAAIPSLAHLAAAVRAEHERFDGSGYPDGVAGEAIPVASRIVLACDAWHAMRSDRPYRRALPFEGAVAELERNAGRQFCPETTRVLLELVRELEAEPSPAACAPARTTVELTDERQATLVRVEGELDMISVADLRTALKNAESGAAPLTLVDLSGVTYMDSAVLSALVQAHRRHANHGIAFGLVAPSTDAHALLSTSGLLVVFDIYASADEAFARRRTATN